MIHNLMEKITYLTRRMVFLENELQEVYKERNEESKEDADDDNGVGRSGLNQDLEGLLMGGEQVDGDTEEVKMHLTQSLYSP